MRANIKDVAREAGVSITTVSRVINNNYPVKQETRVKVEAVVKRLNYKPNIMARSLITRKTGMIGVIAPGITNLFFPTIVEAIEDTVNKNGYSITLCNTQGDAKREMKLVEELLSRQIDGLIVIDPAIENIGNEFYKTLSDNIPLVVISGNIEANRTNLVCYNEEAGTQEAFKYLISLGHKKIAFIRGENSFSYDIKEKIYKNMIKREKLSYEKVIKVSKGNSSQVVFFARDEIAKLLDKDDAPTAIFACNDLMAVGCLNAASSKNLNIPEDVSIIGFDNTLLSQISHPPLTTVDLNMKKIGCEAASELIELLENGFGLRKRVIFDTKLVIRQSCSKAK